MKVLETMARDAGIAVCGEPLLSLSIGAVSCPEHGRDAETLLAEADRRMYLAKRVRRSPVPFMAQHGCLGQLVSWGQSVRRMPDLDSQTSHLALAVKLH